MSTNLSTNCLSIPRTNTRGFSLSMYEIMATLEIDSAKSDDFSSFRPTTMTSSGQILIINFSKKESDSFYPKIRDI